MIRFMAHLAIYSTTSSEANDSVKLCPQYGGFKSESSCLAEGEENKQLTSFLKKHKLSKEFLGAKKTAETGMVTLIPEIVDSLAHKKKYDLAIEVTCRFCWHQYHAERKKVLTELIELKDGKKKKAFNYCDHVTSTETGQLHCGF